MISRVVLACAAAFAVVAIAEPAAQQRADPDFDASVAHPAYVETHPVVTIDQAHNNFHTADGRYQPFATLLRHDGYVVQAGTRAFTAQSLTGTTVLVIANAIGAGANANSDTSPPAFTQSECEILRTWVSGGGSLLLVSDHTPMGAANAILARTFGVTMGQGFVTMPVETHHRSGISQLVFSRSNGLLGDHAITAGRTAEERVNTVVTFTGQSLTGPAGATVLLALGSDAWEAPTRAELQVLSSEFNRQGFDAGAFRTTHAVSAAGRAQGLAFALGNGRVVVLGEAALLSAQITGTNTGLMGMNVPGSDDKQFALNILHWLSRLI